MGKIKNIIKYIKSKKIDSWEIYKKEDNLTYIDIESSNVEHISSGNKVGLGIRIENDKKVGFSYADNINDFKSCIDTALKVSKTNERDDNFVSFAGVHKRYKKVKTYSKELENFNIEEFYKYMESFDNIINSYDNNILTGKGAYKKYITKKKIINSEGIDIEEIFTSNSVFFEGLRLQNKNENINLELGDADIGTLDPKIAKEFGERLVSMKNKKYIKSKKYDIIFHPECFGALLDEFINRSFSAKNIQKKKSVLCNKLNEQVFCKKLSIYDDATISGLYDSRKCDDEGTPSSKIYLIKNGVIKNYLYDSYSAHKEGKKSTGHASRDVSSIPSISTTNLIIKNGEINNLVDESKSALYIKGLMGVHTMNHSTGDFSLNVYEGHKIENGEISFPLKDTMISGNIREILNNIKDIEKKQGKYLWGNGSVYTPAVLVSNIQAIGSK